MPNSKKQKIIIQVFLIHFEAKWHMWPSLFSGTDEPHIKVRKEF